MRKAAIAILTLGIFLAAIGAASAATHTISWSPVTQYTDGTTISGAAITYSVYWSTSSSLSSPQAVATGVSGTSRTFDPAVLGMTPGSTVYFGLKTNLSTGQTSAFSSAKSWTVPSVTPTKTLSSIAISGPSSVNEGATGTYTATATWSDGTTSSVTPAWSLSSTTYASITSAGLLTAKTVTSNQTVTVNASYTSGTVTRTASRSVTIANVTQGSPAAPEYPRISKPESLPEDTWRLSWNAVTTYADGQALEAGTAVQYQAYWTVDSSLREDTLVPLTTSVSDTHVDFRPLSVGMPRKERVYFVLRAVVGDRQSAWSDYLTWRVLNREPQSPWKGSIGYRARYSSYH
jgi:hypothetical protein